MRRLRSASVALAVGLVACAGGQAASPPASGEAAARAAPPTSGAGAQGGAEAATPSPPVRLTRALEAWLGRQIMVASPGASPEPWFLREIAEDHVTLERSRTYRVIPVRRIAEITWTDLTGIDPAPRIVLGPR